MYTLTEHANSFLNAAQFEPRRLINGRFHGNKLKTDYLSETDNPSSKSPSKLIVHPKLTPFHFQIKTSYPSNGQYKPMIMK